jgi:hypothetical protein
MKVIIETCLRKNVARGARIGWCLEPMYRRASTRQRHTMDTVGIRGRIGYQI